MISLNAAFVIGWVVLTLAVLAWKGRLGVVGLAVALLPATGLFVDVGISLSAARIVELVLLLASASILASDGLCGRTAMFAALFLGYAAVATGVGTLSAPATPLDSNVFREALRPLVQWISLFLNVALLFVVRAVAHSTSRIEWICKMALAGCSALAVGGLAHWTVHAFTGVNLFPIQREGLFGERIDIGQFVLVGREVFRANSFAREPKDMATILTIAMLAAVMMMLWKAAPRTWQLWAFLLVAAAATVLSFSTTAVVLAGAGGATEVFVFVVLKRRAARETRSATASAGRRPAGIREQRRFGYAAATFGAFALVTLTGAAVAGEAGPVLAELWRIRVADRLGGLEEYDATALAFLRGEPWWLVVGTGAGNLPRFGYYYLPDDPVLLAYMMNLTWDAKTGLLRTLGSFGVLGTLILSACLASTVSGLLRAASRVPPDRARWCYATAGVVIVIGAVHALHAVDEVFWLALGIGSALAAATVRESGASRCTSGPCAGHEASS